MHINVQLINAATRPMFGRKCMIASWTISSEPSRGEVATAIAEALKAEVTGNEKQAMTAGATSNSESYNAYLRV